MGIFNFNPAAGVAKKEMEAIQKEQAANRVNEMFVQILDKYGLEVENPQISLRSGSVIIVQGAAKNQSTKEKVIMALGNMNGVSQVDDQMTLQQPSAETAVEEAPAQESQFYTVKSGDSLSKIAKEYYGNAMKYPVIFEANKPMLSDPNKIYPGQVLRIPPVEG